MSRLRVCFEIDGIAQDEHGEPCPAGLQIDFGECSKEVPYEELVKNVNIPAVLEFLHLKDASPEAVRIITPEQYDQEYGEEI